MPNCRLAQPEAAGKVSLASLGHGQQSMAAQRRRAGERRDLALDAAPNPNAASVLGARHTGPNPRPKGSIQHRASRSWIN